MEVASPLQFAPPSGKKRAFAFPTPQMMDSTSLGGPMEEDPFQQQRVKRRRFHGESDNTTMAPFPSPFATNNENRFFASSNNNQTLKRRSSSPAAEELNRVVEEQAAVIESLKSEKKELQTGFESLKTESERNQKENHILRKAVQIQQDRMNHAENELKNAQKYREGAEEQMRKMEQMILSLRYHLQAKQSAGNDFMGMPPPSVF